MAIPYALTFEILRFRRERSLCDNNPGLRGSWWAVYLSLGYI